MSSDDDDTRVAYLVGGEDGSLAAHERAGLDELRALLASPVTWVRPPASVEVGTVAAVVQVAGTGAPASGALARSWFRRLEWPVPAVGGRGGCWPPSCRDRARARRWQ